MVSLFLAPRSSPAQHRVSKTNADRQDVQLQPLSTEFKEQATHQAADNEQRLQDRRLRQQILNGADHSQSGKSLVHSVPVAAEYDRHVRFQEQQAPAIPVCQEADHQQQQQSMTAAPHEQETHVQQQAGKDAQLSRQESFAAGCQVAVLVAGLYRLGVAVGTHSQYDTFCKLVCREGQRSQAWLRHEKELKVSFVSLSLPVLLVTFLTISGKVALQLLSTAYGKATCIASTCVF